MVWVNCWCVVVEYAHSLIEQEPETTNPEKTPIQILHEHGIKTGNLPVYVMEKAEGEAHQPSFVFSVTVGDLSCTGMLQSHWPPDLLTRHYTLHSLIYRCWYMSNALFFEPGHPYENSEQNLSNRSVQSHRGGWDAFAKLLSVAMTRNTTIIMLGSSNRRG